MRKSIFGLGRRFGALLIGLGLIGQSPAHSDDAPSSADRATHLKIGPLVQERNGDAVPDFVDGAIVRGESPSNAEVVAAANVAARLGLETTAMNLPLPRDPAAAGVAIAVGAGGVKRMKI